MSRPAHAAHAAKGPPPSLQAMVALFAREVQYMEEESEISIKALLHRISERREAGRRAAERAEDEQRRTEEVPRSAAKCTQDASAVTRCEQDDAV